MKNIFNQKILKTGFWTVLAVVYVLIFIKLLVIGK